MSLDSRPEPQHAPPQVFMMKRKIISATGNKSVWAMLTAAGRRSEGLRVKRPLTTIPAVAAEFHVSTQTT